MSPQNPALGNAAAPEAASVTGTPAGCDSDASGLARAGPGQEPGIGRSLPGWLG